jgi:hypothetical protein
MKRFEQLLTKVVLLQFIFLIIAQLLVLNTPFAPYVNKISYYEGVVRQKLPEIIETIYR